jgi:hypothetical protein
MKRLSFAFCLLLGFSLPSTNAQDSRSASDPALVRATVKDYIEAYYAGDARRMKQTLHPHYLKHVIHGDIPMREKTGPQMIQVIGSEGPTDLPPAERTEQISVFDVAGDIASAKLVTPHWVDYLNSFEVGWTMENLVSSPANQLTSYFS